MKETRTEAYEHKRSFCSGAPRRRRPGHDQAVHGGHAELQKPSWNYSFRPGHPPKQEEGSGERLWSRFRASSGNRSNDRAARGKLEFSSYAAYHTFFYIIRHLECPPYRDGITIPPPGTIHSRLAFSTGSDNIGEHGILSRRSSQGPYRRPATSVRRLCGECRRASPCGEALCSLGNFMKESGYGSSG